MSKSEALLLLPRLRVQNANAISGPLSWGFPSPTAFSGFVHALERRLRDLVPVELGGVGIVCHRFDPQVSRPAGRHHQVFCLTRNPVIAGWKKFLDKPAALVEEGRAHMEVSLLIESLTYLDEDEREELMEHLVPTVFSMRLAGGSILPALDDPRRRPDWIDWPDAKVDQVAEFRKQRRRLLPGFALVQRQKLLEEHLRELRENAPKSDALDALLDLCRLNYQPIEPDPEQPDQPHWEQRRRPGWLVPLAVGYGALSPLHPPGEVANTRDRTTPFRFVESLYTLGQWVSPHRLTNLEHLLWRQQAEPESGIYRCVNHYTPSETTA